MAWLIMILMSSICSYFFPWWTNAIVAIVVGFILFPSTYKKSFLVGGLGLALVWFGFSLLQSFSNDFVLITRVNDMLGSPHISIVFVVQALIAILIGGCSCSSGLALARLVKFN